MGCGASAPSASASVPPGEKKKKDAADNNKKETVVERMEAATNAHADAAAITVVGGATATLIAGAVDTDARSALRDAAAAAGQGLLSFGKELPWVAPLAFLIAGVIQVRESFFPSPSPFSCVAPRGGATVIHTFFSFLF